MSHPVLGQGTVTLPGVQTGPIVPANSELLPKAKIAKVVFFKLNMLMSPHKLLLFPISLITLY